MVTFVVYKTRTELFKGMVRVNAVGWLMSQSEKIFNGRSLLDFDKRLLFLFGEFLVQGLKF